MAQAVCRVVTIGILSRRKSWRYLSAPDHQKFRIVLQTNQVDIAEIEEIRAAWR